MTPEELHDLIAADEYLKWLADNGHDTTCAERCMEVAPPVLVETLIGELGVFKLAADPEKAETILQTIETVAQGNPVVKRLLKWMQPGAPGIDFGDERVRATLTTPIQDGGLGLNAEDVRPILAAAERPPMITAAETSAAWARYRPEGRIE